VDEGELEGFAATLTVGGAARVGDVITVLVDCGTLGDVDNLETTISELWGTTIWEDR
jgi:hypothetical protein